ncbi:hypothetical protein EI94DRAFT_1709915, partial [Lactarius quietus]
LLMTPVLGSLGLFLAFQEENLSINFLIVNGASCHHLIIGISSFKLFEHATLSRLSNDSESALSQEEQNYQKSKIDSKIQQYLEAFSPEDSVMKFSSFIMDTDTAFSVISFSQTGCLVEII